MIMKKLIPIALLGAMLSFVSCGAEEKPAEPTIPASAIQQSSSMMNNLLQQGIQEAAQQLGDTSSTLNHALDTMKNVLEDNQDLIEDKVKEGIDALNKSM